MYLVFGSAHDWPISELIADGGNRWERHHDARLEENRVISLFNLRLFAPLRFSVITDADRVG